MYRVAIVMVGLALVFSACSSGDETADDQPIEPTPTTELAVGAADPGEPEESAPAAPVTVAALPKPTALVYTVEAGDTVGAIAATFGTTIDAIIALNDLSDPNAIAVGQALRLPVAVSAEDITPPAPVVADLVRTEVVEVIDGDTIKVRLANDTVEAVRYIGIDTPETVDPGRPVEPWGPEASAENAALLAGSVVYLESDVSERDSFGRLLRYVWVQDKDDAYLLVDAALLALGLAQVSTFPPDVKYVETFVVAQDAAQAAEARIWGAPAPPSEVVEVEEMPALDDGSDVTPPVEAEGLSEPEPPEEPDTTATCDPSYPTVCIPPPPPDLDCGEIQFQMFVVVGADPHGFDGDGNGVGCET